MQSSASLGKSHQHRVCPWWLGYLLLGPIRRLLHDPSPILAPYLREGMTVLEPGPGMGFFTLELARRVGRTGRVIVVDVQPKMIERLKRRAANANLADRIDARVARPDSMQLDVRLPELPLTPFPAPLSPLSGGRAGLFGRAAAALQARLWLRRRACLAQAEPALFRGEGD
jgi:SAM-dependent methyltransferase